MDGEELTTRYDAGERYFNGVIYMEQICVVQYLGEII